MNTARASIMLVICTHNRADLLARMLDSILAMSRPEGAIVEVLVVANACNDNTETLLSAYAEKYRGESPALPFRWINEPRPGKSFALNTAITQMNHELAAFLDDDQRMAPDFLTELFRCVHDFPDFSMYCGRLLPDWNGTEPDWVHETGHYKIYPSPITTFDPALEAGPVTDSDPLPPGGNIIIRPQVFSRAGGFETSLGPTGHNLMGGEDMEFLHRALRKGEHLMFCPDIIQHHYVDPERLRLTYLICKSYQRSKASVQSQASRPKGVPRYIWKKLFIYLGQSLFSLSWTKTRFYSVRFAAALGELQGMLHNTISSDQNH